MTETLPPEFLPIHALKDKKQFKLLLANRNWIINVDNYSLQAEHSRNYIATGKLRPILRVVKKISLREFYLSKLQDEPFKMAVLNVMKSGAIGKYCIMDMPFLRRFFVFSANLILGIAGIGDLIVNPQAFLEPYLKQGVYCIGSPTEVKFMFKQSAFDSLNMVDDVSHYYTDFARLGQNPPDAGAYGGKNISGPEPESQPSNSSGS